MLRRGPLRTERAGFPALGSSKPRGRCGFLQRPDLGPVLLPRRLEDPAPQPDYVLLMKTPVNGVPVERDVLGPFTAMVSNLPLGSSGHRPRCSKAHLPTSAPFRVRPLRPASGRFPTTTTWSSSHLSRVPSPFGHRHPLLGHPVPPRIPPLLRSAYRTYSARTPTGFPRSTHRDTAGMGAPYTPRPAVFPRPGLTPRSPLAAPTSGQALSPRYSSAFQG